MNRTEHFCDGEKIDRIAQFEAYIVKRDELPKYVEQPCLDACIQLYDKNIRTVSSNGNIQYATKRYGFHDSTRGGLFIHIDYDSMSDENKQIAKELEKEGKLFIDTVSNDIGKTIGGIKSIVVIILKPKKMSDPRPEFDITEFPDYVNGIVSRFEAQDVLYGNGTISDVLAQIKIIENITDENELYKFLFEKKIADDKKNIIIDNLLSFLKEYEDTIVIRNKDYSGFYQTVNVYKVYDEESGTFWANEELLQKHREFVKGKIQKR